MSETNDQGQNPNGQDQNQGGSSSDNGGNNSNNNQDGAGGGEDKDKDTDKGASIPSWRLKEEADKRRAVEEELNQYKEKERKEKEKELKEKGKFDEILKGKEDEINSLKPLSEKVTKLEESVGKIVDQEIATIKASIGEEKLTKILGLVGFDNLDAISKSEALPKIKELVADLTPAKSGKGGEGIDPNRDQNYETIAKEKGFTGLVGAIVSNMVSKK